ncbi:MAG: hypothetical protein RI897_4311 [Verrucomicrobiota bacterium]
MTNDPFSSIYQRLTQLTLASSSPTSGAFSEIALDLFQLQFEQVTPYKQYCLALHHTPNSVREITDIPPLPTSAFKEFQLTSLPPSEHHHVFRSSGTTSSETSQHFHSHSSLAHYQSLVLPWFKYHLLHDLPHITFLNLMPDSQQAPHSSLAAMMESAIRNFGTPDSQSLGSVDPNHLWHLNPTQITRSLQNQCNAGEPCLVSGTAFGFVELLDHLANNQIRLTLPNGSRVMETGGYKGRTRQLPKASLHSLITRHLGVPPSHIVSEYGMCELSSQAYDRIVGTTSPRQFRFPPWCHARLVEPGTNQPPAPGDPGLITLLDLANVRSIMSIQTGDLGIGNANGFEILGRATGTINRGCSLLQS